MDTCPKCGSQDTHFVSVLTKCVKCNFQYYTGPIADGSKKLSPEAEIMAFMVEKVDRVSWKK